MPPSQKQPKAQRPTINASLSKPAASVEPRKSANSGAQAGKKEPKLYHGHRERLRQRFLKEPQSLQDYELLELLLCLGIPRVDVKSLAKQLLQCYHGSLWEIVNASPEQLRASVGLRDNAIAALKIIGAVAVRMNYQRLHGRKIFSTWSELKRYCQNQMATLAHEEFRILCLDKHHKLISDELMHQGTVDHVYIYVREVTKRALNVGAKHVVLVHNHPSGEHQPSRADSQVTQEMIKALHAVDISVVDHLVVGRKGVTSFRDQGLMTPLTSVSIPSMSNERSRLGRILLPRSPPVNKKSKPSAK